MAPGSIIRLDEGNIPEVSTIDDKTTRYLHITVGFSNGFLHETQRWIGEYIRTLDALESNWRTNAYLSGPLEQVPFAGIGYRYPDEYIKHSTHGKLRQVRFIACGQASFLEEFVKATVRTGYAHTIQPLRGDEETRYTFDFYSVLSTDSTHERHRDELAEKIEKQSDCALELGTSIKLVREWRENDDYLFPATLTGKLAPMLIAYKELVQPYAFRKEFKIKSENGLVFFHKREMEQPLVPLLPAKSDDDENKTALIEAH